KSPEKEPEPEPVPDVSAPSDRPSGKETIPPPAAPDRARLRLTAGAIGSLGNAPAPAAGLLVGMGVEHRWWSASAELRVDLPASDAIGSLEARTTFTGGNLVPCAHLWKGYACGVLSLGAIQGEI